jgi:lipoic acid synthetase
VFNHNLETVPRLYALVRPQADWQRSLKVLARAVERGMVVKTGIMVGLGEEDTEVLKAILQVAELGCRMMTVGQYLRPSRQHLPVARYVHPQRFAVYAAYGQSLGIASMACAPLVRSSYHAGEGLARLAHQKGD